jgi:hypothetical protein
MFWLADHPDVQMHRYELHALQTGQPAEMVRIMYELEPGFRYKRGYKAPRDITNAKALLAFAKYFPTTKLIIGLRHPVLWFQSFYNFRIRGGYSMPPAETLMVQCSQYSACWRCLRPKHVQLTSRVCFLSVVSSGRSAKTVERGLHP